MVTYAYNLVFLGVGYGEVERREHPPALWISEEYLPYAFVDRNGTLQ